MQPSKTSPHVLIIGGGFAGIETIKSIKKTGVDCSITLVSKKYTFEYYPALYKLVTGALAIEVSVPLRTIFTDKKIAIEKGTFLRVDRARQVAVVEYDNDQIKEISYDYIVLALGSETNFFNIPGLPEFSYSFKSVYEALRLKKHFCDLFSTCVSLPKEEIISKLNIVIVGGGPSGVELAGDLTHYLRRLAKEYAIDPSLISIDMIEAANKILPTLPEKVSTIAAARLQKLGVKMYINRALQLQDIEQVFLRDMQLKSTTVIWTAGTRINTTYSAIDGVTLDAKKRIAVDPYLALLNDNHVFVIGDGAGTPYSGLAQTAIHNGAYLGKHIARVIEGKNSIPYKPKKVSFVIPIGTNWAILSIGTYILTGLLPWILRSAIDFMYFTRIVSLTHVFGVYKKGHKYRKSVTVCPIVPED